MKVKGDVIKTLPADTNIRNVALFGLLGIFLVASIAIFSQVLVGTKYERQYLKVAGDIRLLSQQMPTYARAAVAGDSEGFKLLEAKRADMESNIVILTNGDSVTGLPPLLGTARGQFNILTRTWQTLRDATNVITGNAEAMLKIQEIAENFATTKPQLQALLDEASSFLIEAGETQQQVYFASRQILFSERMVSSLGTILKGGIGSATAAARFGQDAKFFRQSLDDMIKGSKERGIQAVADPDAIELLQQTSDIFKELEGNVEQLLTTSPEFFLVREAADVVFDGSQTLLSNTDKLIAIIGAEAGGTGIVSMTAGNISVGIVVLILVLLGVLLLRDAKRRERESEIRAQEVAEAGEAQNNAVVRLLDEIDALQDGDLTVEASVDEAYTGAIADAINSAIETMRTLVSSINTTSVEVAKSAEGTESTAKQLAEASDRQSKQIIDATGTVDSMARSLEKVSADAAKSAEVAGQSVDTAHKGGEAVRNTIDGMNIIREQIQETSKRIKRLGESSQEIGEIIGLINDIADQTNILALNAAIQASAAGEAGRGFAVVADEVQRLAERSTSATRQIENLVKAIQTDTNDAVISMELTTAEVVKGANLAQGAGTSLDEIEKESKNISNLVQDISQTASQHAAGAARISEAMKQIQEITAQNSQGTTETAESIGALATMAARLRESVEGFRLPQ